MNKKIQCPACGSSHVVESKLTESKQLTLAPEFDVEVTNYTCSKCGEEGDFALINDAEISVALKDAQGVFIKTALSELDHKASMVRIERAFELPFRTINRWKSGDFSATSIAFVRVLKTFPGIINVAEDRFSQRSVDRFLYQASLQRMSDFMQSNNIAVSGSYKTNEATFKFKISDSQDANQMEVLPTFTLAATGTGK